MFYAQNDPLRECEKAYQTSHFLEESVKTRTFTIIIDKPEPTGLPSRLRTRVSVYPGVQGRCGIPRVVGWGIYTRVASSHHTQGGIYTRVASSSLCYPIVVNSVPGGSPVLSDRC